MTGRCGWRMPSLWFFWICLSIYLIKQPQSQGSKERDANIMQQPWRGAKAYWTVTIQIFLWLLPMLRGRMQLSARWRCYSRDNTVLVVSFSCEDSFQILELCVISPLNLNGVLYYTSAQKTCTNQMALVQERGFACNKSTKTRPAKQQCLNDKCHNWLSTQFFIIIATCLHGPGKYIRFPSPPQHVVVA